MDLAWTPPVRERRLRVLFDTETKLTPDGVMERLGVLSENAVHETIDALTEKAAILLAWAIDEGMVRFDEDRPGWHILEFGFVFLMRGAGEWVDLRRTADRPSEAALARETGVRRRMAEREKQFVLRMSLVQAARFDRTARLPDELEGPDLPPVEYWGDFADNLPGFMNAMPLWRSHQVLRAIVGCRYEDAASAAPELDHFKI